MFGLMKPHHCCQTLAQKRDQRLHYCGTCKTLGRLYGQRTRLLLNYDTVFLAELLTSLSGNPPQSANWNSAYQSKNCLRLPSPEEMPLSLQYAATANVVLTEFKLSDRINDSRQRRWMAVKYFLDPPFRRAAAKLMEWHFPLAQLWHLETLQNEREASLSGSRCQQSGEQILDHLAEPTADATAMFFDHGARLIGHENARPLMSKLGHQFGRLVYLLDAFEDYGEDAKRGEFNAFRTAYALTEPQLSFTQGKAIEALLIRIRKQIVLGFQAVPLAPEHAQLFAGRLQAALWDRLSKLAPIKEGKANKRAHQSSSWFDGCGDCCCDCGCDGCCECGCCDCDCD